MSAQRSARVAFGARRRRRARLFAGGTAGNEQLTAATGVVLIAMLAALGVTIVAIARLLDAHMFIGMLLIGPVALKIASTGYRFLRYYASDPAYRAKGPPWIVMRAIAPVVVLSTIVVFATGVALLLVGPGDRGTLTLLHKASFIVWVAFTALHVLGHVLELPAALRVRRTLDDRGSGLGARAILLASALVVGLVLALLATGRFGAWAHYHHH